MSFEKFCAKCGKKSTALIGGLCQECYLKKHSLFDVKDFVITRCVKCGKILVKGKWHQFSPELVAQEVNSKVKVNPDLSQPKIFVELTQDSELDFVAKITVAGFVKEVLLEQIKDYEFSLQKVSCDSCMKLVSNYREAIIQLRASSISEAEAMMETTKSFLAGEQSSNSLAAAIKTIRGPTGFDLWIGSNKAASKVVRKVSKLYKASVKVSKKIIGEEGGRGNFIYRYTYLVKKK